MDYLLYSLIGFGIVGLIMLVHASRSAPEGIEDEKGFHFVDPQHSAEPVRAPFSLSAGEVLFFK